MLGILVLLFLPGDSWLKDDLRVLPLEEYSYLIPYQATNRYNEVSCWLETDVGRIPAYVTGVQIEPSNGVHIDTPYIKYSETAKKRLGVFLYISTFSSYSITPKYLIFEGPNNYKITVDLRVFKERTPLIPNTSYGLFWSL